MVERARLFIWNSFPPSPIFINMKVVKVKCKECGDEFEKGLSEYQRSEKLERPHFCCRSCSASHRNRNWSLEERKKYCYQIKRHAGNRRDDYSAFRYFICKSRAESRRTRYGAPTISVEYLSELWDKQKGICPYTGISMVLPPTTKVYSDLHIPQKASLDRIDSSKGYVNGNVEFVCCAINLAKNSFTRDQMKKFLREIVVEPGEVESPS